MRRYRGEAKKSCQYSASSAQAPHAGRAQRSRQSWGWSRVQPQSARSLYGRRLR